MIFIQGLYNHTRMASILILTPQLPYPPHQGTSLRNYHILRGLAQRHTLSLLSFVEENQSTAPEALRPLQLLCAHIETVPVPHRTTAVRLRQLLTSPLPDMAHRLHCPGFTQKLRHMLTTHHFDIVQIEGIELARLIETVRTDSPQSKIIFDDHNAEAELQRRNLQTDLRHPHRWVAAAYSAVQVRRLRRFERWACQTADAVTCVSEADRQHLLRLAAPRLPIAVIPNSIDVESYAAPATADLPHYDLVFTGKMDYRPNVDAVLWFADAVWPAIRCARPGATWAIVGQKPHPRLERLRQVAGITLTGWVESVQPYLAATAVVIMPFRIGSGTRLKLIEAMAAGKAIVSTPIGAEGFPVCHRQELYLAETAAELATAVLHLLDHPQERERLGQAARAFARQYDWRAIVPCFDEVYDQVLQVGR